MKRVFSLILSLIIVTSCLFGVDFNAMAKDNSSIAIGDYITLGTYYGEPILWRCVDIDENGPLMLSDKILCLKAYDAAGESNEYHGDGWGYIRKRYGSNCWYDSSIRQWLNTSGEVKYTHCPPTSSNVYGGYNAYESESGFLTGFSSSEISLIKNVTQKVYINEWETHRAGYCDGGSSEIFYSPTTSVVDYSKYYYQNVTDKIFFLGPSQADAVYRNFTNYLKEAYPTQSAVNNSDYTSEDLSTEKIWDYWYNVAGNNGASYEHVVTAINSHYHSAYGGLTGVRPAFYLNTEKYTQHTEYNKTIENMLGDINLGPYALNGATIDIAGRKIPLVNFESTIKLNLGNFQIVDDGKSNTVKVLLGFNQDSSANINGSMNSGYWSDSYREVKSMYQELTGKKVDTTRLWNKYSSMRGKLKKIKCDLVVDVDATLAGYLEFKKVNGSLVYSEGGLMAEFGASASMRHYYGPAYATLGIELGAKGKLYFTNESDKINPAINVNPSISLNVGGGIGTRNTYAEIVGYGTLGANISTAAETPFKAYLDLGVKWGGYVLGKKIEKISGERSFAKVELYPNFGADASARAKSFALTKGVTVLNKSGYDSLIDSAEYINRDYLKKSDSSARKSRSKIAAQSADNGSLSKFKKTNAYPLSQPSLVSFNDDTALLVWIDDNGEKSDANKASLYYSYYNGASWSAPQTLFEDGTNNDMPSVYSDGERAYIVWQRASKVFDDAADMSEMIKYYNLYETTFIASSGEFSDPICINSSDNTAFEFNPVVYGSDGAFSVSWMENSDNNVYQESGNNTLYLAKYDSAGAQTELNSVVSTTDIITKFDVAGTCLYYSVQSDEANSLYYYSSGSSTKLVDSVIDFSGFDNRVYYIDNDSVLKDKHKLQDFSTWSSTTYSEISGLQDIKIAYDSQKSNIYLFTTAVNEDYTKDLYYCKIESETCTPLEKYSQSHAFIRNYSPIVMSDGTVNVAYNNIDFASSTDYEKSTLLVDGKTDSIDTQLNYVDFDNSQLNSDTIDLNCEIQNNSCIKIDKFKYIVSYSNGNIISSGELDCSVDAFETAIAKINITSPQDKKDKIKVTVLPSSYDDYNEENNVVTTTFECVHSYDETIVLPTCDNLGKEAYVCKYCGDKYEIALPKLDASALCSALEKAKEMIDSKYQYSSMIDYVETLYNKYSSDYHNYNYQEIIDNATTELLSAITMTDNLTIKTVSLSLESSITMNFKVLKNNIEAFDNLYMTFKCGDKEEIVTKYTEQGSYYVFSYTGISPQLMNDDVTAVIHATANSVEYTSPKKTMSVKTYAYTMLNRYSNNESYSKLCTLLVDLLNYGAAAQTYIGYQTNNLVNAELTDAQKSFASQEPNEFNNIRNYNYKTIDNPTVKWTGCGLVLNNSVMIRAKFSAVDVENKTVEICINNTKFTYSKDNFVNNGDGTYYVYCNEIFANEMSDEILFTVYENGKPCSDTMRFSIESYAALVKNNYKGTAIDKLTTAMIRYGISAKAYSTK